VKEFGSFLRTPLPKESNFSSFLTFPINESKVIMFDIALSRLQQKLEGQKNVEGFI
jgi:hypothetical protein